MNTDSFDDIKNRIKYNNLPDKEVELYWYELNNIIKNCFHSISKGVPLELNNIGGILNNLQEKKKYQEIEQKIQDYISTVCKLYVIHNCPIYHFSLLDTQIKRWNRISKNYPIFRIKDARINNYKCVLFYIYYKYQTYKRRSLECDKFFKKTDYNNQDLYELVDLAIQHNYPYFLDKLRHCIDIIPYINDKYNCKIYTNTCGNKILNALKKHI